jgi:hypothetical protein
MERVWPTNLSTNCKRSWQVATISVLTQTVPKSIRPLREWVTCCNLTILVLRVWSVSQNGRHPPLQKDTNGVVTMKIIPNQPRCSPVCEVSQSMTHWICTFSPLWMDWFVHFYAPWHLISTACTIKEMVPIQAGLHSVVVLVLPWYPKWFHQRNTPGIVHSVIVYPLVDKGLTVITEGFSHFI